MKRTIIAVTLCLVATPAHADSTRIESPRGITQSEWSASDTYRNFQCASNENRAEGVDMNFTTNRNDDYWFVECSPRVVAPVYIPTPITTTPPVVVTPDTATVVTDTTTAKIETATVSSVVDFTSPNWLSDIMTWFNNFIKQFYALLEGLKK